MTPVARLWPFRSPGLGPKGTVKGRQGQENGTGALSPGLLLELHVPRLFPEGCGQRCTLANQKFVFLESQPKVDWANGDPVGGGENWLRWYFPKNDLCLLSAKQKKHQSSASSGVSQCVLNGILLFLYATNSFVWSWMLCNKNAIPFFVPRGFGLC